MRNTVIIGASSGIGNAIALQEIVNGNQVFGTYNKTIVPKDGLVLHPLNVLDETFDTGFLPDVVDGLVYCPGSVILKPFARLKPADFIQDYKLQVVGAIKVIQALLPKLKGAPNPSIVLFSTVAVRMGSIFIR